MVPKPGAACCFVFSPNLFNSNLCEIILDLDRVSYGQVLLYYSCVACSVFFVSIVIILKCHGVRKESKPHTSSFTASAELAGLSVCFLM